MEPEVAEAIETLLKVYDRWPEGSIIYKKPIVEAIAVLRAALAQWQARQEDQECTLRHTMSIP